MTRKQPWVVRMKNVRVDGRLHRQQAGLLSLIIFVISNLNNSKIFRLKIEKLLFQNFDLGGHENSQKRIHKSSGSIVF